MQDRSRSERTAVRQLGAVLGSLLLSAAVASAVDPSGSPMAQAALSACNRAATLSGPPQLAALDEGRSLADAAVASDPRDPVAHFAAFCARGRHLEILGVGAGAIRELRQARQALDTALALASDYSAALAAKGALLLKLPRLFGGDPETGATLLRRAAVLAPDDPATEQLLAELLPLQQRDTASSSPCE